MAVLVWPRPRQDLRRLVATRAINHKTAGRAVHALASARLRVCAAKSDGQPVSQPVPYVAGHKDEAEDLCVKVHASSRANVPACAL